MHRILLPVLLLLSLSAAHSETHDDIITAEVRETMDRMAEKWNSRDLLGALAFYMNSPDTRMVRDGKVYHGWDTIYEHYNTIYQNNPGDYMAEVAVHNLTIEPYNANTASVFFEYDAVLTNGATFSGASFFIMKRSGPYWRITHANMSSGRSILGKERN